jgi:L-lactate dehydrogenase
MRVGIVGTGMVGSSAAYAMIMAGIGREIVLVDLNRRRAEAEAQDLFHAVPFAGALTVRAGEYADLAGCRAVIISAGVNQKPGETRLELLKRNAEVFHQVVPNILAHAPDTVLVVATNPVDIMTHLAAHFAAAEGRPESRVLGSGTMLDSARFRTLLGEHFRIDPQYVHGYVVGEHGDSEVLVWSRASIAGLSLADFSRCYGQPINDAKRRQIDENVRTAAYQIIGGKGSTYYGIGSALARIVDVLLHDQRAILSVCARVKEVGGVNDVTLSLPHVVGGAGVLATIPLPLDEEEQAGLERSAAILRQAIDSLEL